MRVMEEKKKKEKTRWEGRGKRVNFGTEMDKRTKEQEALALKEFRRKVGSGPGQKG